MPYLGHDHPTRGTARSPICAPLLFCTRDIGGMQTIRTHRVQAYRHWCPWPRAVPQSRMNGCPGRSALGGLRLDFVLLCMAHEDVPWREPGNLRRSWLLMSSVTAGSPERTRIARCRGCGDCGAI